MQSARASAGALNAGDALPELGEAFQLAYATTDREQTQSLLDQTLGTGNWVQFEASMSIDQCFGGGIAEVAVAFARWGRVVVEVLQPLRGNVAPLQPFLPDARRATTVHHVGVKVTQLDEAVKRAERAGADRVFGGRFADQLRFEFVDTRDQVGHLLELVEFSPEGWQLIAGLLSMESG